MVPSLALMAKPFENESTTLLSLCEPSQSALKTSSANVKAVSKFHRRITMRLPNGI
ncbi:protein of unknown function (plasmid) [Shinella sp. WSC3-e]|nr:hypothetical protein SHINE37_100227 [Rhizobiaceae bacterium]CAK7261777.1 protein of unknown function [Shinella sp. WSC3-e]